MLIFYFSNNIWNCVRIELFYNFLQGKVEYLKSTQRALKGTWATKALEHSCTRALEALEHLRHSGTRRALGCSGTQALGHFI